MHLGVLPERSLCLWKALDPLGLVSDFCEQQCGCWELIWSSARAANALLMSHLSNPCHPKSIWYHCKLYKADMVDEEFKGS